MRSYQLGLRSAVLKAKKGKKALSAKRGLRFVQKGAHPEVSSVDVIPIPSGSSGERSF